MIWHKDSATNEARHACQRAVSVVSVQRRRDGRTWRVATVLVTMVLLASGRAIGQAPQPLDREGVRLDAAHLRTIAEHLAGFREDLPRPASLGLAELAAYEEHGLFVYVAGRMPLPSPSPSPSPAANGEAWRHVLLWKPSLLVIADGSLGEGVEGPGHSVERVRDGLRIRVTQRTAESSASGLSATQWEVLVQHVVPPVAPSSELQVTIDDAPHSRWVIQNGTEHLRLSLPFAQPGQGAVEIVTATGDTLLDARPLPAGVLPHGRQGAAMLERWDAVYRGEQRPGWDVGRVASDLQDAVARAQIRPGRLVEFGCGSGTNAIFLAGQGFDVTAIDVAPTALTQAQHHARAAGVTVRWLLADVTAPPALEPFDVVFDRGCYHGVRRENARGYLDALRRLTRPGSRVLILAGNANEQAQSGPPRVSEQELRDDFSADFEFIELRETRFDSAAGDRQGALAWSILLERK